MSIHLLDLVDELILAIAQAAPISDLLRLRLTCQKLYNICDFPLKERCHRLYLHPRSLYYAIDVCNVPKWSDEINEVVILGSSETSMITRESHQFPDCRLDYHPWPQFPPTVDGEVILEYKDLVSAEYNSFVQNYSSLIAALEKLPLLRTIKYAGSDVGPGFCSVTQATVTAHAKQKDLWRNSFGNDGQPQMRAALRTIWWSDADVFSNILASFPRKLIEVDIQQPMPAVTSRGYRSDFGPIFEKVEPSLGAEIVRYTAPGPVGWTSFVSRLLADMPALRTLQVDVKSLKYEKLLLSETIQVGESPPWEEDVDVRWRPSPIICPGRSPDLQTVTVRGPSSTPYAITTRRLKKAFKQYTDDRYHLSITSTVDGNVDQSSLQKIAVLTLSRRESTFAEVEEQQ